MAVSTLDLGNRILQITHRGNAVNDMHVGTHHRCSGRVNHTRGGYKPTVFDFNANPNGDSYYLPYYGNEISSVMLPSPPPPGVMYFFTDNLTSCSLHIDRHTISNSVIVYHANALLHSPPAHMAAANPALEHPSARGFLDGLYANARMHYGGPGVLTNLLSFYQRQYAAPALREIQRKQRQQRTIIGNLTGTTVIGLYLGGTWQFWYQTWGYVDYRRPAYAPKAWLQGLTRQGVPADIKVYDFGRIL